MTSKQRKWVFLLIGVGVATSALLLLNREREPSYQGRPLSEWIEIYAAELDNNPEDQPAATAIRAIGTNALPHLLKLISFEPPDRSGRTVIGSILLKLPFVSRSDRIVRWCRYEREIRRANFAGFAFGVLGTNAQQAIPELVAMMNATPARDSGRLAVIALAGIGEPAIPALLTQLGDTNAPNRREVAFAFGYWPQLITNKATYLPLLVSCLEDIDENVRRESVLALSRIAVLDPPPEPSLVVPALIKCLNASKPGMMWSLTARALESYGDQARAAVPTLLKGATAPDTNIRSAATNALMKIAPEVLTNAPPQ